MQQRPAEYVYIYIFSTGNKVKKNYSAPKDCVCKVSLLHSRDHNQQFSAF